MPRRSLLAAAAAAAVLAPHAPASADAVVVATGYAVRNPLGLRSATGVCVATGVGATLVVLTECGFAGEDSGHTATSAGPVAVATFTGPIGEQPKTLCWAGYAVDALSGWSSPFSGCTQVS